MRFDDLTYALADYGEGMNLSNLEQQDKENFHVGHFEIRGTLPYLDPILKNKYLCSKEKPSIKKKSEKVDLFKTDIYSLGLTYYITLTGEFLAKINE